MIYEIFGNSFPAVTIELDRGESIFTQAGGLAWMSEGISMDTNMRGGFLKGLGRLFTGDSLFLATYTAERDGESITLSASLPGEVRAFEIDENSEYIAQKGAFLGATEGVEVEMATAPTFMSGLFGGEGFLLQRIHGNGLVFMELDGSIKEIELAPGEKIRVDSGNVALFESCVEYDVETVKGFKNVLFGGEGLFLTTLTGPGKVWLQTMTVKDLAGRLIPYLPTPSNVTVSTDK